MDFSVTISALSRTVLLLAGLLAATAQAATTTKRPAPGKDQAAFGAAVRDYLLQNPGVIREALQALEVQEQQAKAARAKEALVKHRDKLINDPAMPVGGNPKGDVTVVEFFDYRCGYCKRVAGVLGQLVAQDPGVRVVYREFPILGPESLLASRSALAANKQGKYVEFHKALMEAEHSDEATVTKIATDLGLDLARFRADRDDASTSAVIDATYSLASELEIGGTPAFVIGDRLVPGAAGLTDLMALVAAARAAQAPVKKP